MHVIDGAILIGINLLQRIDGNLRLSPLKAAVAATHNLPSISPVLSIAVIGKMTSNVQFVRDLILTHRFFAARCTDDLLGRCFTAKRFTQAQKSSRCMRAQREI